MPLQRFVTELDEPVSQELAKKVITYMKGMPAEHAKLILQCAEFLDKNMTNRGILTVAYALNGGEILLKCHDELDNDFTLEFDRILSDKK